eukprot:scaffold676_cov115-Isochrysis_galbana.AAC.2
MPRVEEHPAQVEQSRPLLLQLAELLGLVSSKRGQQQLSLFCSGRQATPRETLDRRIERFRLGHAGLELPRTPQPDLNPSQLLLDRDLTLKLIQICWIDALPLLHSFVRRVVGEWGAGAEFHGVERDPVQFLHGKRSKGARDGHPRRPRVHRDALEDSEVCIKVFSRL